MLKLLSRFRSIKHSSEVDSILACAQDRARSYEHDCVGVEHVFLCMNDLPVDHIVKNVLDRLPVNSSAFMADLEKQAKVIILRKAPAVLPMTPRLQFVLKRAQFLAKYGHAAEIRVIHLLGAIASEGNSLVAEVFRQHMSNNTEWTNTDALAGMFATLVIFPQARIFDPDPTRKQTQRGIVPSS